MRIQPLACTRWCVIMRKHKHKIYDPVGYSEIASLSNLGIVMFRENQMESRDAIWSANTVDTKTLRKWRYAETKNTMWPDGTVIPHCKRCKFCIQIMRSLNGKLYHLGYWCSCYQTKVNGDGNCSSGSERMKPVTIVIGDSINKRFESSTMSEEYAEEHGWTRVRDINNLSTLYVDNSDDKSEEKLSTGSYEQGLGVVEKPEDKPQDVVENKNQQL